MTVSSRDHAPDTGSALDPFNSPLCRFWVSLNPGWGFGWAVRQRGYSDGIIRTVSGPFWRRITAERVCADLRRIQADAWQIAVDSSAKPAVGDRSRDEP